MLAHAMCSFQILPQVERKGIPESNSTCHHIQTHLSQPAGTCTQQLQQLMNCLLHQKEEAENQMLRFFLNSPITSNQVQMLFPPQESDT